MALEIGFWIAMSALIVFMGARLVRRIKAEALWESDDGLRLEESFERHHHEMEEWQHDRAA
jgi:hypothetical protein